MDILYDHPRKLGIITNIEEPTWEDKGIKMPLIPGVIETLDKLKTLHKTKNDDYAGNYGPFFNFDFAEQVSSFFKDSRDRVYAVMIGIKLARLSVVLTKAPNHESVEDTFDDCILYMTIWKSDYMNRNKTPIRELVEKATLRETK